MRLFLIILSLLLLTAAAIAQPLGEVIGSTYYLNQSNGPSGSRIKVCDDGSIYVCWMNLFGLYPPAIRHIYYNWRSPEGQWFDDGCQVSENTGAGYCNLDIYEGDRGCITYHCGENVIVAIEWDPPGIGFFNYFNAPNELFPQTPEYPGFCMWPQISIDSNEKIHLFMTENADMGPRRFGYTRSEDGGSNWTDLALLDTVMVISGIVVSSPVSDRVAICYLHPDDTTSQMFNWPYYIISEDGQTWDFDDIIDVPYPFQPNFDLWAYANLEAIFDYNDQLHLAWPVYGEGYDWLLHYSDDSDTIEVITQIPDTTDNHPIWELLIGKASLSRDASSNALVASWGQYAVGDTNINGIYNGDIYLSRSNDLGLTWQEPLNITNTPSPDCLPGDCMSELYPCAAEEADSMPHITYIFDPFIQPEPSPTSPALVMYIGPDHLVDIEPPIENIPRNYSLAQNYPNPFNASTTIKYDLPKRSNVTIDVFDILGRKVETFNSSVQTPGSHSVVWNALGLGSGIYFYKIQAGNYVQTRRCMLIK
ncbi:MAG: T9SS type A sorting domain-containing protein [candidate division Zixibacteria bacterium]|nr:T9SS type A sorting domain-containing protein [candidate division Zixibacteria bacterium]